MQSVKSHSSDWLFPILKECEVLVLIFSVLIAIPLSILANLLTPHVTIWYAYIINWYAEQTAYRTERRIRNLESQLEKYRKFLHSPTFFAAYMIRRFLRLPLFAFMLMATTFFISFVVYVNPDLKEQATKEEVAPLQSFQAPPLVIPVPGELKVEAVPSRPPLSPEGVESQEKLRNNSKQKFLRQVLLFVLFGCALFFVGTFASIRDDMQTIMNLENYEKGVQSQIEKLQNSLSKQRGSKN